MKFTFETMCECGVQSNGPGEVVGTSLWITTPGIAGSGTAVIGIMIAPRICFSSLVCLNGYWVTYS